MFDRDVISTADITAVWGTESKGINSKQFLCIKSLISYLSFGWFASVVTCLEFSYHEEGG